MLLVLILYFLMSIVLCEKCGETAIGSLKKGVFLRIIIVQVQFM